MEYIEEILEAIFSNTDKFSNIDLNVYEHETYSEVAISLCLQQPEKKDTHKIDTRNVETGIMYLNTDGMPIGTMQVPDGEELHIKRHEVTECIIKGIDGEEYRFTPGPVDGTVRFEEAEKKPKTYLECLKEVFPNIPLDDQGCPSDICPSDLGLEECCSAKIEIGERCKKCWNQPMEE